MNIFRHSAFRPPAVVAVLVFTLFVDVAGAGFCCAMDVGDSAVSADSGVNMPCHGDGQAPDDHEAGCCMSCVPIMTVSDEIKPVPADGQAGNSQFLYSLAAGFSTSLYRPPTPHLS